MNMPFRFLRRAYCIRMFKLVLFTSDTITIRILLGWSSLGYAGLLILPLLRGHAPLFERPAYALMAVFPGGEWTWAFLYFMHFIGVHWRALDPKERIGWGLAVNILGVFIWAYSTVSLNIALGTVLPGTALEWVMVAFSSWALWRTGLTRELASA